MSGAQNKWVRSNRPWRRGTDGLGWAQMFGGKKTHVHTVKSTSVTPLKHPADFCLGPWVGNKEIWPSQPSADRSTRETTDDFHFSCKLRQICFPSGELLVTSAAQPSETLAKITSVRIKAQHKFCLHSSHTPSLNALYSLFPKVRTKDWSRVNWKS